MAGKSTMVVLENTASNTTQEFDIDHAERILRMPNNGGWQLPENSVNTFDETNGIGFKQNSRKGKSPEESANDQ